MRRWGMRRWSTERRFQDPGSTGTEETSPAFPAGSERSKAMGRTVTKRSSTSDGNASVGGFPAGMAADWFVNYSSGNYGLQNEGLTLFADVASWTTGDPPTLVPSAAKTCS